MLEQCCWGVTDEASPVRQGRRVANEEKSNLAEEASLTRGVWHGEYKAPSTRRASSALIHRKVRLRCC